MPFRNARGGWGACARTARRACQAASAATSRPRRRRPEAALLDAAASPESSALTRSRLRTGQTQAPHKPPGARCP
eukprot:1226635-Pyramimonas_sp.AAC.1